MFTLELIYLRPRLTSLFRIGDAVTVPSTISVNALTTVTVTQLTATAYTAIDETVTVPTSTKGVGFWKTVATGVFAATVCSNGANPVTVTECK